MKKLLLLALMIVGISASAQENGNYRILTKIAAGNAVTAYLYITAPKIQKSYVIEFGSGVNIDDAVYDQGDIVRVQWIDGEIVSHSKLGALTGINSLDVKWDRIMQKRIKELERKTVLLGFNLLKTKTLKHKFIRDFYWSSTFNQIKLSV